MTARVSRMNLARWITTEEFGEQEEGEYVLPSDEDVPVQVGETSQSTLTAHSRKVIRSYSSVGSSYQWSESS